MKAPIKLATVHHEVKQEYKDAYADVIKPYIAILKQVMQASNLKPLQALEKMNNSDILKHSKTGNKKKDDKSLVTKYQKQRLFVSAALTMLEA